MKDLVHDDLFKHVHDFRLLMVIMADVDTSGTLQTTFSKLQTSLEYIHNRQVKQPSKSVILTSLERLEEQGIILTARTEQGTHIKLLKYLDDNEIEKTTVELRTEQRTSKNQNVVNNTNIYDQFFLSYGKQPTPLMIEKIFAFHETDGLELEVISKAIEKASSKTGNIEYLYAILRNWHKEGIKETSDLEKMVKGENQNEKYEGRTSRIDHKKYDFGF